MNLIILIATLPLICKADYKQDLQKKLEDSSIALNSAIASQRPENLEFKQFWLGFAASNTFGINSVLSVQVSPEITFEWEKLE